MFNFLKITLLSAILILGLVPMMIESGKWKSDGDDYACTHVFRHSMREDSRVGQEDPLFLWLGRPSKSLHVGGKYGNIPMPTVWSHFVNVLYVSQCISSPEPSVYGKAIASFLSEFVARHERFRHRKVFLSGSMDDPTGGAHILNAATEVLNNGFDLSGVVIGNPSFSPSIQFFRHKSFEQANDMTFWSVDRARQPIVCNGLFSQVEFIMHDIHLKYTPAERSHEGDVLGSHEYQLSAVHTADRCYTKEGSEGSGGGLEDFSRDWGRRPLPPYEEVHATLSQLLHNVKKDPFQSPCDSMAMPQPSASQKEDGPMGTSPPELTLLLSKSVPIVMYSQLYQNPTALCSFYIGIFEADAMRYPISIHSPPQATASHRDDESQENSSSTSTRTRNGKFEEVNHTDSLGLVLEAFSRAPLEVLDTAYSSSSSQTDAIAHVQDGTFSRPQPSQSDLQTHTQRHEGLVWIQIDSRYGTAGGSGRSPPLSRALAVDILAFALGKDHRQDNSEILEYIDLLV